MLTVEDKQIVDLYWARADAAISETQKKYGRYCHSIAYHILCCDEDAEECTNDTYLKAWAAMPPHRPEHLASFLGKITRNLALDRYEKNHAKKRGCAAVALALDELEACIPAADHIASAAEELVLKEAINRFLWSLPADSRKIFVRRYWYLSSVKEIAQDFSVSESKVKMVLLRLRGRLKLFLEKEGIEI